MKKTKLILLSTVIALMAVTSSCKKCGQCYAEEASGKETSLGEFCGKDKEELEESGTTVNGVKLEVHCHEH